MDKVPFFTWYVRVKLIAELIRIVNQSRSKDYSDKRNHIQQYDNERCIRHARDAFVYLKKEKSREISRVASRRFSAHH